ncbi:MAG TPA: hypothetical protein VGE12_14265 [Noviherbaspirillum sp.]
MSDKTVVPIRQHAIPGDKPRSSGDAIIRLFKNRLAERQRAERERMDRYGRFGGR